MGNIIIAHLIFFPFTHSTRYYPNYHTFWNPYIYIIGSTIYFGLVNGTIYFVISQYRCTISSLPIFYICVEEEPKKPKEKQTCNDLSAQLRLFFAALASCTWTYERERECVCVCVLKKEIWKAKSEMEKLYV